MPGLVLLGELGRGNDTVVYRARRTSPNGTSAHGLAAARHPDYAVKVLGIAATVGDDARHRFRREAAVLACVDHPGVVQVHAVGEQEGRPYLVMDLVEGQALADRLVVGRLDEAAAAALGAALADALAAAHRVGLIHRDVKPRNIMVRPDGRPVLIDFGLIDVRVAELGLPTRGGPDTGDTDPMDAFGLGLRSTGAVAGTLAYCSPEQSGLLHRPVDGRSDLYSLGAVLYECVTGRPPFTSTDAGELLHLHATALPPDPRALRPDLSVRFAAVLARLLAKDPDDRYPNASALADDLRRLLPNGAPGGADPALVGIDMRAPLALVGRRRELATLLGAWRRATTGTATIVVLDGPAGSGKSRLAEELAVTVGPRDDKRPGPVVLTARAVDGASPLAPLRTAVENHVRAVERLTEPTRTVAIQWLTEAAAPVASYLRPLSPALAALCDLPDPVDDPGRHHFPAAVATFLLELARRAGGLLVRVEDAHALDDGTVRVIAQLVAERARTPVMVLATSRGGTDLSELVSSAEMQELIDERITLEPLDADEVAELVERLSGRLGLGNEFAARIARASAGNPLAVLQYFRAALEAGLIRPAWGRWIVDLEGLTRVRLPTDVVALLNRRIEQLSAPVRGILVAAAALGVRFEPGMLTAVSGASVDDVRATLDEAGRLHVVERRGGSDYGFVHAGIRRALLTDADPLILRRVHQRAAELMEQPTPPDPTDPAQIYRLAWHRMAGEVERNPGAAAKACVDAARQALADSSPPDAVTYCDRAERISQGYRIPLPPHFAETFGTALHQSGRYGEALDRLAQAVEQATDPLDRGRLLVYIGQVHLSRWEADAADVAFERALDVLGMALPEGEARLAVSTTKDTVMAATRLRTGVGAGTATGPERERLRLAARALVGLANSSVFGLRPKQMQSYAYRALLPAIKVGASAEYVAVCGLIGAVSARLGRHSLAQRAFAMARDAADELGDPHLDVQTSLIEAQAWDTVHDDTDADRAAALLGQRGHWLDVFHFLNGIGMFCWQRLLRGDVVTALAAYRNGAARLPLGDDDASFVMVGAAVTAACGRLTDAYEQLADVREKIESRVGAAPGLAVMLALTEAQVSVEAGDVGERFDEALARFTTLDVEPDALLSSQRAIYVYQAYGRLEQCRRVIQRSGDVTEAMAAAQRAVTELEAAANSARMRVHALITRAEITRLAGDPLGGLDTALGAGVAIRAASSLLAEYESARVRARALIDLADRGAARRAAREALDLANEHGWPHRADWVKAEFELAGESPIGTHDPNWDISRSTVDRQRLAALEQVSSAAARVLDPEELARVGLDESVRILRAERGLFFLPDEQTGRMVLWLGRTAHQEDLSGPAAYASSLVDRVQQSRRELVVTGTEDGAALGSESMLAHGIRSVVVAPLELDSRLLGVVYLDSRLASGVFRPGDAGILTAICRHVAAALETARAAQLATEVATVQQERDVANLLRAAMIAVSNTLDPAEVLSRLHTAVTKLLPGEVSWLVEREEDGTLLVSGAAGFEKVSPATLERLLAVDAPTVVPIGGPASLLVIPLTFADPDGSVRRVGVLLIAAGDPDAFRESHLGLAAALTAAGMVQYQNALLFRRVAELATIDGLTGATNRRYFYETGAEMLEAGGPIAAIMVDIDHFKQVNDRYGHGAGDKVIAEVAARLKSVLGPEDLLGRYGGEEFAVLLDGADSDRAEKVARELHAAVGAAPVETDSGPLPVTVSVGVRCGPADDLGVLLGAADEALYSAKRAGRDRVVVAHRALAEG
ncbi:diguanylate cyclase [Cryptosporangium phraense]|uniref:diguanylate cyclase n=1 Tax=Cryptosporangium phraense TaxID=2593070 RepID=UPI00197AF49C|nr:diguanylate cyclase [Cryptosporangium phraense]